MIIQRYIDNPKFIPDELSKVSKAGCALCMWVRAIDLYTKIFKSIEPKRIKLLEAESELAALMTALREETDRVAHTENTIAALQSSLQERTRKRQAVFTSVLSVLLDDKSTVPKITTSFSLIGALKLIPFSGRGCCGPDEC